MNRIATTVNQFHSGTGVGDAVTNEMFTWRDHLRQLGYRSEIFGEHVHPALREEIRPITSYLGEPEAVLIVHHSMGYDAFDDVLELPDRKVLAYHNITPENFFDDEYSRRYVRLGHRQLRRFAAHAVAAVAVSAYNRRDLIRAGYRRVSVIPIKTSIDPNIEVRRVRTRKDWLFVGRLVPNKRQIELVEAFAHQARIDRTVRLHLIGDASFEPYVTQLERRIRSLALAHRVRLHGKVSDAQLAEAYRRAGVFVCLSEHEGYGVPLLEAMEAGLPVVARAAGAVPETMGGAGVLLHDESPQEIANVVRSIVDDDELRAALVAGQRQRARELDRFDVPAALSQLVCDAMDDSRPLEVQIQGPFETSYSLARVNRRLALELDRLPGVQVSIHATEGPGDYTPRQEDLASHPEATTLYERSASVPYPDVVIRQLYPPRVADAPGGINLLQFGWEETRVPVQYVTEFNEHLNAVGTMSEFVTRSLIDSGLNIPVEAVGIGVDPPTITEPIDVVPGDLPSFRFLNIGSAFPRKGLDVLLRAYFGAFTSADDVVLILKTFPNPHNDVGSMLTALSAETTDPPSVWCIDRDISDSELDQLFGIASCYVHSSRGEGFGLPVAEAMLARVPVVAISQSGTADFIDSDVATTIPYRMAPAASHVSVEGSEWAEPDSESLSKAMRLAWERRSELRSSERVAAAHDRIATEYSWTTVAERWFDLIERTRDQAFGPNVALVSTWNSRCGIAEYSRRLIENVGRRVDIRIFADRGATIFDQHADEGVVRSWRNRWEPDLSELAEHVLQSDADVVHIQFNFGFFALPNLARLVSDINRSDRAVVVTLHATHEPVIDGDVIRLSDIALMLRKIDRIIVHQQLDAERLAAMGVVDNVEVVPHGATVGRLPARTAIRSALGLGDRPVVSTFGFALPHKGLIELITAMKHLRRHHPDVVLLACCALHADSSSARYLEKCRREVVRLGLQDQVRLITDFLSEDEARTILGGSDVVVLPYGDTPESASGALRSVIGTGTAVLTSTASIFEDAARAVEQVDSNHPAVLASAIERLLDDDELRSDVAARCVAYAREVSWTNVAQRHAEIYREVARRRITQAARPPLTAPQRSAERAS